MTIRAYQTLRVILQLILLAIIYYIGSAYVGDDLIYLNLLTLISAISIIIVGVNDYCDLFRN